MLYFLYYILFFNFHLLNLMVLMVVGKTYSSFLISDLYKHYRETDILASYFNVITLPCCIKSPLRKDEKPSFGLYLSKDNHVRFIDYATGEHGDLMDLLCTYWNCNITTAIDNIYKNLPTSTLTINSNNNKVFIRKEEESTLEVKVRAWHKYDYEYWQSYGVNPKLLKAAEVYPVSHKIITKRDIKTGKINRMVFKTDKYAYVFVERKEGNLSLKLYQPFNKNGFKWFSKMDASVVSLWSKMPQTGDKVIICSSLKDALCITSQLDIPAIALQGEGYGMSTTAIRELKKRFKKIFISFDVDKAGLMDGEKLSKETGFINVIPDLGKEKDYSDFFKSLKNKEDFKKLKTLFT